MTNGHHVTPPRPQAEAAAVPFFTQAAAFDELWPVTRLRLSEVVDHGAFCHGRTVGALERALAAYTGARHVVGVGSGTDALVLLLRAGGLCRGEEVILPALAPVATASAVVLAGGRPVFADVDPRRGTLDPAAVAAAVTPRTAAVLPVHLFGRLADLRGLLAVAAASGLSVVEDAADAVGVRLRGVHAGLLGAGGALAFGPAGTLGALGDAGAVVTDDPMAAEAVAALRRHGRRDDAPGAAAAYVGVNAVMDDIQAAVLLAKLTRLDADITRRVRLAAAYAERLSGVPGVTRAPAAGGEASGEGAAAYVIEADRRDELAAHLAASGIGTRTPHPVPLHLQPCFADLGHRPGSFPHAEAAAARMLALPLYPELPTAAVERVCDAVRAFCDRPQAGTAAAMPDRAGVGAQAAGRDAPGTPEAANGGFGAGDVAGSAA